MLCAALRLSPTTRIGPAAIADRLHRVNTNRRNNRRSRATPPIRCCAVGFCTVLWLVMEQSTVISASALGKSVIGPRSEEHTSELQSLMRISYAVFCLKKKKKQQENKTSLIQTLRNKV